MSSKEDVTDEFIIKVKRLKKVKTGIRGGFGPVINTSSYQYSPPPPPKSGGPY